MADDIEVVDMNELPKQQNKKTPKKALLIISLVCFLIAVVAIVYLIHYYVTLQMQADAYESLREENTITTEVQQTEPSQTQEVETTQELETTEDQPIENLDDAMNRIIDFENLQQNTNADIYAWISIPDTNIDYPILQHPTNDLYYLDYNLDGTKGYPGCIYSEKKNSQEFTDFNTVLYGHNMKNGSMFHDLHNYEDSTYMEEHQYMYIYLPDQTLKYEIFAAYQYDDRHLLYSFDYKSENVRNGYLEDIINMKSMSAVINKDITVDADSKIITMSTCVGNQSAKRFLVQAVLMDDINE